MFTPFLMRYSASRIAPIHYLGNINHAFLVNGWKLVVLPALDAKYVVSSAFVTDE